MFCKKNRKKTIDILKKREPSALFFACVLLVNDDIHSKLGALFGLKSVHVLLGCHVVRLIYAICFFNFDVRK